jgi:hypothetical protein
LGGCEADEEGVGARPRVQRHHWKSLGAKPLHERGGRAAGGISEERKAKGALGEVRLFGAHKELENTRLYILGLPQDGRQREHGQK